MVLSKAFVADERTVCDTSPGFAGLSQDNQIDPGNKPESNPAHAGTKNDPGCPALQ